MLNLTNLFAAYNLDRPLPAVSAKPQSRSASTQKRKEATNEKYCAAMRGKDWMTTAEVAAAIGAPYPMATTHALKRMVQDGVLETEKQPRPGCQYAVTVWRVAEKINGAN